MMANGENRLIKVFQAKPRLPVQTSNFASSFAKYLMVTAVFAKHSSERKGGSAITMSKDSRKHSSEPPVGICPNDIGDL